MTSTQQPRPSRRHLSSTQQSRTKYSRNMFHGSINFEQQKKRAKDLYKAMNKGENIALLRFSQYHPKAQAITQVKAPDLNISLHLLKLSDCQLVISRENGFASWPQLKTHCDRLALRKKQISEGTAPQLDDDKTLHIRCGSDIKHGLGIAGFVGEFHEFSDPFCQGPVPNLEGEAFYKLRADFISTTYGLPLQEIQTRQKLGYEKLDNLHSYTKIVLWFEHDSYDQLILAYLLNHISGLSSSPTIDLICVDDVPGVPGFTGLGQLAPEMLVWVWENCRAPLTEEQIVLGKVVWKAVQQDTPMALEAITSQGTPEIPPMAAALERHLQELPAPHNGLSLTQQLSLEIIADSKSIKGGKLFNQLMREREPLPFLGDLMFWSVLAELAQGKTPLIAYEKTEQPIPWPERQITLTNTGKKILNGDLNYLDITQSERWVGGIKISL
ncbi:MAG: DUF1835 domain-containing protein [Halopseudomonas aestusnigri]